MSGQATATGALESTPMAQLLVYALEKHLDGTFVFQSPEGQRSALLLERGVPVKAKTAQPVAYLGRVLLELGAIDEATCNQTLARIAKEKRLHGELLIDAGAIDHDSLEIALTEQLVRQIVWLFSLPPETAYGYYAGQNYLERWGAEGAVIQPLAAIWRGIRSYETPQRIEAALARVGARPLRLHPHSQIARFRFSPADQPVLDVLRAKAQTAAELASCGIGDPNVIKRIVYALVITRHLDVGAEPVGTDGPMPLGSGSGSTALRVARRKERILTAKAAARPAPPPTAPPAAAGGRSGPIAAALRSSPTAGARPLGPPPEPAPPPASTRPAPARPAPPLTAPVGSSPAAASSPIAALMPPMPVGSSPFTSPSPIDTTPPSMRYDKHPPPSHAPPPPANNDSPEVAAFKAELKERNEKVSGQNYYEILGVDQDAPSAAISAAFFQLAKRWHPDRLGAEYDDVKAEAMKMFSRMTEAHQTLTDADQRKDYDGLIREGGGTAGEQEEVQKIMRAVVAHQKATVLLRKQNLVEAEALAKEAMDADPEQKEYVALYVSIVSQKANITMREMQDLLKLLNEAVEKDKENLNVRFARGELLKRMGKMDEAVRDFKWVADRNPRNVEAIREVRLYVMRVGEDKLPGRKSVAPKKDEGGLFGKLFKK